MSDEKKIVGQTTELTAIRRQLQWIKGIVVIALIVAALIGFLETERQKGNAGDYYGCWTGACREQAAGVAAMRMRM